MGGIIEIPGLKRFWSQDSIVEISNDKLLSNSVSN